MAKGIGKKIRTGKSTEAVAGTALGAGAASDMWVTIHLPVTREMFGELAGLAKVEDRTIVSAARKMIEKGLVAAGKEREREQAQALAQEAAK
jgi:hypothetical protein